jgi:hypothetical protein
MASVNKVDYRPIIELYLSGLSITDLHKKTLIPLSNIRYALKKNGVLRTHIDAMKLANNQGKFGVHLLGKKRVFSESWKQNLRASILKRAEEKSAGVSLKPNGYIEITRGENKYHHVHRVVMEEHIARRLLPHEVVHHKDHNRQNNAIENLELMTRVEHARHHAFENLSNRTRNQYGQFE